MTNDHFDPNLTIPHHVAIIMDGNGRWAKERGLERTKGHREGLNALRRVAVSAAKIGIKVLTVYAFSTENWKRPKSEIRYLMDLPKVLGDEALPELMENKVKVTLMGEMSSLPSYTLRSIKDAVEKTKNNTGLILNIAFNYGSRDEITKAVKQISSEVKEGRLEPEEINEDTISSHLMTEFLGEDRDPDLVLRSSGETRLSNFLLWQLAYSEMIFAPEYWPDFDEELFLHYIAIFQHRHRRFGGLDLQDSK